MNSVRDVLNVLVAIALITFIGLNVVRLGVFFWQSQHLI